MGELLLSANGSESIILFYFISAILACKFTYSFVFLMDYKFPMTRYQGFFPKVVPSLIKLSPAQGIRLSSVTKLRVPTKLFLAVEKTEGIQ